MKRSGPILLGSVLIAGAALRIWLALGDDGIYWPDEIYNSLEPAHRLVFGYGMVAWEFVLGARTWAFPGLIAALLKLCALAGLTDPRQYLTVIRLTLCGAGLATAYGSYLLARRHQVTPVLAACGASFFALAAPALYFAPKALAEPASALPVVFGLVLTLPAAESRRRVQRLTGASLLSMATLLRLHNALFCLALLVVWLKERRYRDTAELAVVFAIWALVLGVLDWATWGEWFRSLNIYVRFNYFLEASPVTGPSPASYYFQLLFRSMPLAISIVAVLAAAGATRARGLAFVIVIFLVAHVVTPNKAYRYILAALPLLGALSAVGLQVISSYRPRVAAAAAALLVASCAWSALTVRGLTFADIGPYEQTRPADSAFDDRGPVNRLLMVASRQPDICGLRVETDHLVWIGGYSYFHRDVPLYSPSGPERGSGFYNYIIATVKEIEGNPVASDGEYVLRRLRNATCRPDPISIRNFLASTTSEKRWAWEPASTWRPLARIRGVA